MSDVLIKSIRLDLRRSADKYNNIKLSIYKSGIFGKKRILKVDNGDIEDDLGNKLQPKEYTTDDGSDDNLIIDYLHKFLALVKSVENHNDFNKDAFKSRTELDKKLTQYVPLCKYEIVEDNYTNNYESKSRAFGYDYYYFNNGVTVHIEWTKDSTIVGGKKYSDNWGYEVNTGEYSLNGDGSKWKFNKRVRIWFDAKSYGLKTDYTKDVPSITLDKDNNFIYAKDETYENANKWNEKSGAHPSKTLDSYILSTIVDKWNELYTNKELRLLSLDSDRPTIDVKFIDPVDRSVPVEQVDPLNPPGLSASTPIAATPSATASSKIPLVINDIPEGFTIQAKTDMPLFSIYVGEKPLESSNIDIFDDSVTADDEYIEADFSGIEESIVNLDDAFISFPESTASYVDSSNASLDEPFIEKSMAKISDASKKETESDKQLTLIRESTGDRGVKGTMYFNGKIVATTLERPYNPPQDKNQSEKCITSGTYKLSFTTSGKSFLKKHYVKFPESDNPIHRSGVLTAIDGVPSQQGIRIHGGGDMNDSKGCVLVSDKRKSNGDLVYNISIAQYITKLINLKKIKNIKIINEFLN